MHLQFDFLKHFFASNGFPSSLADSQIKKFLYARVFRSTPVLEERRKYYYVLPYFGYQSEKLRRELNILLSKYFSNILFKIISVNKFTIGSHFGYKGKLP